ncbi:MAG: hypothetical protein JXB49_12140 [Bacteroidales bacterium]|nr:hypothetical protein [Bacteroidales bacterium]
MKKLQWFGVLIFLVFGCIQKESEIALLNEDFSSLRSGPIGGGNSAHTEYHYLHDAAPHSRWQVSTFHYSLYDSWFVRQFRGRNALWMKHTNNRMHWHPMVITGDPLWKNYKIKAIYAPASKDYQSGIVFRYHNDRCYYFFGVKGDTAILKMVKDAKAFRQPYEIVLAKAPYAWKTDSSLTAIIEVHGTDMNCKFIEGPVLTAQDTTFASGKLGFLTDVPTFFQNIEVTCSQKEYNKFIASKNERDKKEKELQAANPQMVLWKKVTTNDFGTGRNLRFGDLNNDGETDILLGQVVHHGHKDRNSELSCLTAMTLDGDILWQKGRPDDWKTMLTNDVAMQIHDIDDDGKNEVIYCMGQQLYIVNGETGTIKKKTFNPPTPGGKPTESGHNIFPRILGDCIFFCDLDGNGKDDEFILKDRYEYLWAYTNNLQVLWHNNCNTGHYPYSYDTDNDGKDEIMLGYTLFDDNGEKIWSLDNQLQDHADAVAIVPLKQGQEPTLLCTASDEGMLFIDLKGNILKHHYIGHVQNPGVANFRDDLPGLETVSVNFWGNQGIFHFYDSDGNIYLDIEPNQYGSMCLPLNWTGKSEEYFIINANVVEGGVYDGWGRKVLNFPDDGHPDMCYAVLDITGDCRDEIVVWDPSEIWIYTQDDNPKKGKLYKPLRNPLYNYSNYQATVSLEGWNE